MAKGGSGAEDAIHLLLSQVDPRRDSKDALLLIKAWMRIEDAARRRILIEIAQEFARRDV